MKKILLQFLIYTNFVALKVTSCKLGCRIRMLSVQIHANEAVCDLHNRSILLGNTRKLFGLDWYCDQYTTLTVSSSSSSSSTPTTTFQANFTDLLLFDTASVPIQTVTYSVMFDEGVFARHSARRHVMNGSSAIVIVETDTPVTGSVTITRSSCDLCYLYRIFIDTNWNYVSWFRCSSRSGGKNDCIGCQEQ